MGLNSLIGGVIIGEHFVSEGPVVFFSFEFKRHNHALLAVLAFVLLSNHEAHVGINTNGIARGAHSKRHNDRLRLSLFFLQRLTKFSKIDAVVFIGVKGLDNL